MRSYNHGVSEQWAQPIPEDVVHIADMELPPGIPLKAQKLLDLKSSNNFPARKSSSDQYRQSSSHRTSISSNDSSYWSRFRSKKSPSPAVKNPEADATKATSRLSTVPTVQPPPALSRRESSGTLRDRLFGSRHARSESNDDNKSDHRNLKSSASIRSNATSVIMGQNRPVQVPKIYPGDTRPESRMSPHVHESIPENTGLPAQDKAPKKSRFFRSSSKVPSKASVDASQQVQQTRGLPRKDLDSVSRASLFSRSSADTARTDVQLRTSFQQQQQPHSQLIRRDSELSAAPTRTSQQTSRSGLRNWFDNVDVSSDEETTTTNTTTIASRDDQRSRKMEEIAAQPVDPSSKRKSQSFWGWRNRPSAHEPPRSDASRGKPASTRDALHVKDNWRQTSDPVHNRSGNDTVRSHTHQPRLPSALANKSEEQKTERRDQMQYPIHNGTSTTGTDYMTSRESIVQHSNLNAVSPAESPVDNQLQPCETQERNISNGTAQMIAVTQEEMAILNMIRQQRAPVQSAKTDGGQQLSRRREAMLAKASRKLQDGKPRNQTTRDPNHSLAHLPSVQKVMASDEALAKSADKEQRSTKSGPTLAGQSRTDGQSQSREQTADNTNDQSTEQARLTRPTIRSRASSLKAMQTGQTYIGAIATEAKSTSHGRHPAHQHNASTGSTRTAHTSSTHSINSQPNTHSGEKPRRSQFMPVPMFSEEQIPASPGPPPKGPPPAIPQSSSSQTAAPPHEGTFLSMDDVPKQGPLVGDGDETLSQDKSVDEETSIFHSFINKDSNDEMQHRRDRRSMREETKSDGDTAVDRCSPNLDFDTSSSSSETDLPATSLPVTKTQDHASESFDAADREQRRASTQNPPTKHVSISVAAQQQSTVDPTLTALPPMAAPPSSRDKHHHHRGAGLGGSRFSVINEVDPGDEILAAWTSLGGTRSGVNGY